MIKNSAFSIRLDASSTLVHTALNAQATFTKEVSWTTQHPIKFVLKKHSNKSILQYSESSLLL